jgi:hypothetical protein
MSELNIANEVLGNEELRAKYDQGEDPNVTLYMEGDLMIGSKSRKRS